ncbi:MAG: peptidoglycan DD-metalloendopeptidase family protein [Peptococcia bacterium]
MVNKKKIKSLAVYIAVVLLLFAFLVPVLQDKIRQNTKPDHPENLTATPVGEINGEELAASSASSDTPASSQELEPDLNTIIWPLEGQVIRGVGLSYAQTFSDYRYHDGIDIQAARGAEVIAALPGKVISKETSKEEKTKITIEHGRGWISVYAHLENAYFEVGDFCQAGDVLGTVNQPGLKEILEGPHLHYSLRHNEQIVNPLDYLPERP